VGFVGYLGLTGTDVLYVVPPEPVPDSVPVEPTVAPSITPPAPTTTAPPPSSATPAPATATRRPAPATPRPAPVPVPAPKPAAKACPTSGFGGVKSHVAQVGFHLRQRYAVTRILGVGSRIISTSDHPLGTALDLFVDRSTGDAMASYLLANQDQFGVKYLLWRQRYNDGGGWRVMDDRGSATANHQDHLHSSFDLRPGTAAPTC
jgi:uncharacterized protein YbdZ (MbtH family)